MRVRTFGLQSAVDSVVVVEVSVVSVPHKRASQLQTDKSDAEKALIETYLPAGLSEAEIDSAIAEALAEIGVTSVKQMGVVMKNTKAKLGYTADHESLAVMRNIAAVNPSLSHVRFYKAVMKGNSSIDILLGG